MEISIGSNVLVLMILLLLSTVQSIERMSNISHATNAYDVVTNDVAGRGDLTKLFRDWLCIFVRFVLR